jgi:phosphohistidine phosphatase
MKSLYAMRHAKSSWSDPSLADFDRPLARRGIKAARSVARVLDDVDPRPELALCSTAVRAVQTYEAIASRLQYSITTVFRDDLYGASSTILLNVLRDAPENVSSVLLIGHNPGIQELLIALTENDGGDTAGQLRLHFPTAALAVLRIRGPWARLAPGRATLDNFVLPRTLETR